MKVFSTLLIALLAILNALQSANATWIKSRGLTLKGNASQKSVMIAEFLSTSTTPETVPVLATAELPGFFSLDNSYVGFDCIVAMAIGDPDNFKIKRFEWYNDREYRSASHFVVEDIFGDDTDIIGTTRFICSFVAPPYQMADFILSLKKEDVPIVYSFTSVGRLIKPNSNIGGFSSYLAPGVTMDNPTSIHIVKIKPGLGSQKSFILRNPPADRATTGIPVKFNVLSNPVCDTIEDGRTVRRGAMPTLIEDGFGIRFDLVNALDSMETLEIYCFRVNGKVIDGDYPPGISSTFPTILEYDYGNGTYYSYNVVITPQSRDWSMVPINDFNPLVLTR